jgi:hypothetical protein
VDVVIQTLGVDINNKTSADDLRFGLISRADVADFIVRQIGDCALIGATPLLIN